MNVNQAAAPAAAPQQAPADASTAAAPAAAPAAPPATSLPAPQGAAAPAAAPTALPPAPGAADTAAAPATFGAAVEYEPTGKAGIDMAMQFLGSHGLGPQHPAMLAADGGDFGPLKALMAGKGIPGWEQYVALAEDFAKTYQAEEAAKAAAVGEMCVAAADGSPELWQAALDWASVEAEPAEREAINTALAGGGLVAEAMAHFLVNGFKRSPGSSYEGKPAVQTATASRAPESAGGPLDPRAYGAEVMKLHAKLGGRMESSAEYAALNRRRAAYRG